MREGAATSEMQRNAPRRPERETKEASARRKRRRKLSPPAILVLGLSVPFVHSTQATELQYARAIGHEFLPQAETKRAPNGATQNPGEQLPRLGESTDERQSDADGSTNTWTKVLIGAVVLGAIAALGNRDGGGDTNTASAGSDGSSTGSGPATDSGGGSGTGIGIGGGGISIGVGGGGN